MTKDNYHRFPDDEKVKGVDYAFYRELLAGKYDAEVNRGLAPRSRRRGYTGLLRRGAGEGMSSFSNPHYMYLFEMKNGKKKLAYGESPEDALDILRIRLSEEEMAQIIRTTTSRSTSASCSSTSTSSANL